MAGGVACIHRETPSPTALVFSMNPTLWLAKLVHGGSLQLFEVHYSLGLGTRLVQYEVKPIASGTQ